MSTENTTPHQQELRKIFDQLPSAKLYGDIKEEVKLINFGLLETLVDKMMTQAYYNGKNDGLNELESMVSETFSQY
jgi:hypothetical protein